MNTIEQVKVRNLETGQIETIEICFKKHQTEAASNSNNRSMIRGTTISIHPHGRKPVEQIVSADGKTHYVPRT